MHSLLYILLVVGFQKALPAEPVVPDLYVNIAFHSKCDTVPTLNQAIVEYVTPNIKKRVGRGECWDLANEALRAVGARWDGRYKFGQLVDPESECIYPGDIIQFEGVKTVFKAGTRTDVQEFPHHTAIIYSVKDRGHFVLAHQNTAFSGKKVGLSEFYLQHVTRGRVKVYRPVSST